MNKVALLNIIKHVSAISEQEVAELEKLAASFPYCQTAHLLLAKAAYDHGSMLSNQRLRRAAACATNRHLLKKLIYTAVPDLVVAPIATPPVPEINQPIASTEDNIQVDGANLRASVAITMPDLEINTSSHQENVAEVPDETSLPAAVDPEEITAQALPGDEGEISADKILKEEEIGAEAITGIASEPAPVILSEPDPEQPEVKEELILSAAITEEQDTLFLIENLSTAAPLRDPVTDFISHLGNAAPEALVEEALTAYLYPDGYLREVNTGTPATEIQGQVSDQTLNSPIEGGLSADENEVLNIADETLAQFDEYLFKPEKEPEIDLTAPYKEEIIYKVFSQNDLGYWMASSRLGESLQLKDELTPTQPFQFQPDLILEYSKLHELDTYMPPADPVLNKQFDLIDQFLRQNPKLKSMANIKVKAEPLEDLSSRSTKIKKNLASETLANILVKQGKTKKAIKIYEHLMLKIPEKKAYFASQIQKLQKLT